ncbi:uncharacterized protein LAESUDRAFT_730015 [Laetiporus sulphureus 93-53]|uniref:Secreted protein n=1 Tax=Laetiporus sulphureus 93-53 TaxID=1314785 RepID=A0A165CBQ1_9APHY|nr:uncharacterized protein LAESUDRAFT_730015 [Laetiporus sulphureus 93-53]KZT02520.1 hypothetical protein LAESUDRAFT_730015 [Laetiporus sulphureus 93-53]
MARMGCALCVLSVRSLLPLSLRSRHPTRIYDAHLMTDVPTGLRILQVHLSLATEGPSSRKYPILSPASFLVGNSWDRLRAQLADVRVKAQYL